MVRSRWIPALVVAPLLAWGCDGDTASDSPAGAGEAAPVMAETEGLPMPFELTAEQESGRLVWQTVCWTCHGEAGRGDGPAVQAGSVPAPPDLHADPIASMSAQELERRFRRAMEGQDPTHPHMRSVGELLKPEVFADALAFVPALVWPEEVYGSAFAGRERYEELCMSCHGEKGEGHGTAADVLVVPPAQFPTDTLIAAEDWQGVFDRIKSGGQVHGSAMPPWGVMLSDAEIWDLVAYLGSFQAERLSPPPAAGG